MNKVLQQRKNSNAHVGQAGNVTKYKKNLKPTHLLLSISHFTTFDTGIRTQKYCSMREEQQGKCNDKWQMNLVVPSDNREWG